MGEEDKKKALSEKERRKLMDSINDVNPMASYLNESTFSTIENYIDTGSLALNAIISGSMFKGIPEGRVVQFAGPSQTGKSYFVQKIMANAQKMGKTVVVFDSENAIDKESAKGFGIDVSKVKYIPAKTIENTRNAIFKFLKGAQEAGAHGEFLIVIDSLANMESELGEKRMDKDSVSSDMGTFAKAARTLLKTCTTWAAWTRTTIVFTNHVYDDPNAMYPSLEKNMQGGRAAVYLPSITVQLARKPVKDDDGKTIDNTLAVAQKNYSGVILRCLTVKNRFIKQYLEAEVYLSFATGLDKHYGLLELAKGMGVVVLNGKTYTDWKGNSLGYYKNFRKDKALWDDVLLPELESRLLPNWSYANGEQIPEEELEILEETSEDETYNEEPDVTQYEEVPDEDED